MDFFSVHNEFPIIVLLGCAFFPRITMLFIGGPFAALHWLGWLIAPHITVAVLACLTYWDTNRELCVISIIWAVIGTGGESSGVTVNVKRKR